MTRQTLSKLDALRHGINAFIGGYAELPPILQFVWPDAVFDDHQFDIIGSMLKGLKTDLNEIAIKGCTGAGKGAAVAVGANLWFEAMNQAKVAVMSSRYDHAVSVMLAEIISWRKRMEVCGTAKIHTLSIKEHEEKFIRVINADDPESLSGLHGPASLAIFDESSAIGSEFPDNARKWARLIACLSNPRTLSGWFKDLFSVGAPDDNLTREIPGGCRRQITIGGSQCRNVIEGKVVIPNQITRERYEAIMAHADENHRLVFGEGRFPKEDAQLQLIPPSWLPRHLDAWHHELPVTAFGLDVARSDAESGDETILTAGGSGGIRRQHTHAERDLMAVCGWVIRIIREEYDIDLTEGRHPICVDTDGLGGGVTDRLRELGCWVIEHRGNMTADDPKKYKNRRTETHALLGGRLDPAGAYSDEPFGLPRDQKLLDELAAPEKVYESDGLRFGLIPKESPPRRPEDGSKRPLVTIKQKLGRSPDRGDSAAYFYRALLASADSWDFSPPDFSKLGGRSSDRMADLYGRR